MANYGIKPSRGATGSLVLGQTISVSSSSATMFGVLSTTSNLVVVQFRGGDVYATFDGTTVPSASSGFQLYNQKAFHWDVNTAKVVKMLGVSGSVTASLQELQIYFGDSTLPDLSVVKSNSAP